MPSKNKQKTAATGPVSKAPAESAPAQDGFSLISNQKLLQLYAGMVKCRLLDERIRAEMGKRAGSASAPLPAKGREAAVVGVLMDTLSDDSVSAASLDIISLYMHGMTLAKLFRIVRKGGSAHSAAAAVANTDEKAGKIRIVVSGGGEAEQHAWTEALRLASLHHPPTIFLSWKPRKTSVVDFPTMTVDACDVVAVYRVASESIAHARQGFGPTLIECQHWEGSDASRNPIVNMEKYLGRKELFNSAMKAQIAASFRAELDAAAKSALG